MEKHKKGSKKHLSSTERFKILKYLSIGFNIPKIAKILGYNKTSIYREIIINSVVENRKQKPDWSYKLRSCKNSGKCDSKGIKRCPKVCMRFLIMGCPLIVKPFKYAISAKEKMNVNMNV